MKGMYYRGQQVGCTLGVLGEALASLAGRNLEVEAPPTKI